MSSYEIALKESIEYFKGDKLAAEVFLGKYAMTSQDGEILENTPKEMHLRLAKELARIEKKYPNPMTEKEIFSYLDNFKYIVPQGSPMSGIGNKFQTVSLSNCFVIKSPYDSYGGILLTDQEQAQLMKRRGGVGFDISPIRPKGVYTNNAAKTTDGIGVFMERFSNTCREVAQGGRRGALMLSISVHHPEIKTFINIKRNLKKVTGANISIRLSDEFMNAVKKNEKYEMRWPVDAKEPVYSSMIDANEIWNEIIASAHASAEPGLLFWDTIKKESPADAYESVGFGTVSTNPCGEITLSEYDSCRLLLVNTVSFVENPFTPEAKFDFEKYAEVVRISQRLMDDIVDLELECIDKILTKIKNDSEPEYVKNIEIELWNKIRDSAVRGRRTGTGVTAVGDALAGMNLVYGSDKSVDFVEDLYKNLALNCYRSTVQMAKERGAFPAFNFDLEKDHVFVNRIMDLDPQLKKDWEKYGRRNIALTTTAPAGSVSILTQTTSGIEPAYMLEMIRRRKINPFDKAATVDFVDEMGDKWQEYTVYHHWYQKWMEITGNKNIKDSPYYKATSSDIDWVAKVKVQSKAQKWICHSISNTTNIPKETTVDTVKQIYMTGWETGCKGVTVYREGSRSGVLVSADDKQNSNNSFKENHAPKRKKELECEIVNATVNGEKWTFIVGQLENKPYEIFGGLSKFVQIPKRVKNGKVVKHNGVENSIATYNLHYDFEKGPEEEAIINDITNVFENKTYAAFTRTVSLSLRHGVPIQYIVEQLTKGSEKEDDLFSFSRAVSRVLKNYIKDGTKINSKKCPECSSDKLIYQEGCVSCVSCGHSKC